MKLAKRFQSLEFLDPFQRATSRFHTLAAIAWTIARVTEGT